MCLRKTILVCRYIDILLEILIEKYGYKITES